jgi:hypothetical protein
MATGSESAGRRSEHGEVGLGIAAHDRGRKLPIIGETHFHRSGVFHDVVVGEDMPRGRR